MFLLVESGDLRFGSVKSSDSSVLGPKWRYSPSDHGKKRKGVRLPELRVPQTAFVFKKKWKGVGDSQHY
jgi:hypothetical protein